MILKELEAKAYPFPDFDFSGMLDELLQLKMIEFSPLKRLEEMGHENDLKYCCYHWVISHPIKKRFILKKKIMDLAQEGKIEIDSMKDITATNMTTVTFGSFSPTLVSSSYVMLVPHSQDAKVFPSPYQLTFESLDSIIICPIVESSSSRGQVLCAPRQEQQAPLVEGVHYEVKVMHFDDEGWIVVT